MKVRLLALVISITFHWSFLQIPTQSDRDPLEAMGNKKAIPIQISQKTHIPQTQVEKAAIQKQSDAEKKSQKETSPTPKPKPLKRATKVAAMKPRPSSIKRQKQISGEPSHKAVRRSNLPKVAKAIGQVMEKSEEQEQSGPVSLSFQDLKGGYQVMPVYPMAARRERRQGAVLLKVEILESGLIGKLSVVRSSNSPDLDTAAMDAVRQWRFEPALRNGSPVQQITLLPIRFDLRSN